MIMITIHHNFDPKQFMWLWAKYVKAGNIGKHCTACMIGPYSKKFSGTSNPKFLEQTTMIMDEVGEGLYEAIYFCGVLKAGYLDKNPLKNNYQHNVHFAVRPMKDAHDVYEFETWSVEIEGGILERIPATYELDDRFFQPPYTSHYYTCRIFRWMVGHFYPQELTDGRVGYPENLISVDGDESMSPKEIISDLIRWGQCYAKNMIEDETCWGFFDDIKSKENHFKTGSVNRIELANYIADNMGGGGPLPLEIYSVYAHEKGMPETEMVYFIKLGIEEYLDMLFPYQTRRTFI